MDGAKPLSMVDQVMNLSLMPSHQHPFRDLSFAFAMADRLPVAEQQRACPSVQCAPACQICSAPNTHHTLLWVHHQTSSMCHPAVATTPPDLSPHNSFHQQIAKNGQNCKTTANHLKNVALIARLPFLLSAPSPTSIELELERNRLRKRIRKRLILIRNN